jgi:hypothetical protein
MSMLISWVVTSCGLVGRYQCFEGIYCVHLQGTSALKMEAPFSNMDIQQFFFLPYFLPSFFPTSSYWIMFAFCAFTFLFLDEDTAFFLYLFLPCPYDRKWHTYRRCLYIVDDYKMRVWNCILHFNTGPKGQRSNGVPEGEFGRDPRATGDMWDVTWPVQPVFIFMSALASSAQPPGKKVALTPPRK